MLVGTSTVAAGMTRGCDHRVIRFVLLAECRRNAAPGGNHSQEVPTLSVHFHTFRRRSLWRGLTKKRRLRLVFAFSTD